MPTIRMSSQVESMMEKVGLFPDGPDPMTEIPEIQVVNPRYAGHTVDEVARGVFRAEKDALSRRESK